MHFGEHVLYDGYGGDPARLDDGPLVERSLSDLVAALGMTILGGPEIYRAPTTGGKDPGGWTGTVVLQESHVSIHTFPARGFLSADVYSCQYGLDPEAVRSFFQERFGCEDDDVTFVHRGERYPAEDLHPEWVTPPVEPGLAGEAG